MVARWLRAFQYRSKARRVRCTRRKPRMNDKLEK
jgi:hypothetical protein